MDQEDDYVSYEDEEDDDYYNPSDDPEPEFYGEEETDVSLRKSTSQVITKETLIAAQKEVLVRVMELLSVKENHARILLIHYQWNVDKLFSVYADRGIDSLFASAGLTVFDPCLVKSKRMKKKKMTCGICMEDDIPSKVMTTMECGHSFCNDCWKGHFTVKIDEGASKMIRCMAHKCNAICDEDAVRKLVEPKLAEKFDRFLVESYVEDNMKVKWCPSTPHCGNAMRKLEDDGYDEVECSCGHQFCFSCLCESHSPCSCLMWKLWSEKCKNESETINWITVNTRVCPKCRKAVEKRDGCNHMTCICGQCFCYLCGGATGRTHSYQSIEGHSCGRYKDEDVRNLERAKRDLDRYTHYHYRYKAHNDSLKLEDELRESVLKKAEANSVKKEEEVFKNYSWVIDAGHRLFISRRILANSYAFAFYMFGEELFKDEMSDNERVIKQNLFEDQQQQLEGNVEKLSNILREPFDEYEYKKVEEMKSQLHMICGLVDTLCKRMYECIENDLLGQLEAGLMHKHNITTYRSNGIAQAAQFCAHSCQSSDCGSTGSPSDQ